MNSLLFFEIIKVFIFLLLQLLLIVVAASLNIGAIVANSFSIMMHSSCCFMKLEKVATVSSRKIKLIGMVKTLIAALM